MILPCRRIVSSPPRVSCDADTHAHTPLLTPKEGTFSGFLGVEPLLSPTHVLTMCTLCVFLPP